MRESDRDRERERWRYERARERERESEKREREREITNDTLARKQISLHCSLSFSCSLFSC